MASPEPEQMLGFTADGREPVIAKLARERAGELVKLAEELEGS